MLYYLKTKTAISGVDSPSGNLNTQTVMEKSWCWHMALKPSNLPSPLPLMKTQESSPRVTVPESQNHGVLWNCCSRLYLGEIHTHESPHSLATMGLANAFILYINRHMLGWNVKTNSKAEPELSECHDWLGVSWLWKGWLTNIFTTYFHPDLENLLPST